MSVYAQNDFDDSLPILVHLAAEVGWQRVTPDEVARRTGVSRSAVRCRWPDRTAMATDVVRAAVLLPIPGDQGSLAADLAAVSGALAEPLSPDETAVAGLLGDRAWSPTLSGAVLDAVDRAPRELLGVLAQRAAVRGEHVLVTGRALRTLRALLTHRLSTGPLDPGNLCHLADGVLLPALVATRLTAV